jgi:hypothetical protein
MSLVNRLFGADREEMWRRLASELDGKFEQGGWFTSDKVQVQYKEWTVTLDAFKRSTGKSAIPFTRIRAPFLNTSGFYFKIYEKSIFSGLGVRLGMQDIQIGDTDFDERYVIQGNDEAMVRTLFQETIIRSLIAAQPDMHLEIKDDEGWFREVFPEGVDELYYEMRGTITDIARLEALFDLFAEMLDRLCSLGIAAPDNPQIEL